MTKPVKTESWFKWMEMPLCHVIQRGQNDRWGWMIYSGTVMATPFTILADMVTGFSHLFFLGVKNELSEEKFWDISHDYFFVYPFQQGLFVLTSLLGTALEGSYLRGYTIGQRCILDISNTIYQGPPKIFNHFSYESVRHFELERLIENVAIFNYYRGELKEKQHALGEVEWLYQVFYAQPPIKIDDIDQLVDEKTAEFKTSDHRDSINQLIDAAQNGMKAFYSLPFALRRKLTTKI